MKGLNKLTGLGAASLATLCLAWSGLSHAGMDAPDDFTTVSRASVKIRSYEQTASGETEKVTVDTDTVILNLTGDEGDKPPKNQQLVLLNWCGDSVDWSALAVWDKDTDELVPGADAACLDRESSAVFDDKKDKAYTGLDIDAGYFGMDEIDMDVEISFGKVKKKIDSNQTVCLKKFKTLAMAGYYENGDDVPGSRVMRKSGSIKTNGGVKGALDGNVVSLFCGVPG
jgi:hypothetical protein